MKKNIIKYISLLTLAVLLIACPTIINNYDGNTTIINNENSTSNNNDKEEDTNKNDFPRNLYYSTKLTDGVGGVDGLDGAKSVSVSPDGKNVYVAGPLDNAIVVFNRNTTTGALTYSTRLKDGEGGLDGLAGAETLIVSPDGKNVYVASFHDNAVAVFDRNDNTGALSYRAVIKDGDNAGAVDGLAGASAVTVSPDGTNVYVTGHTDDAVVVFNRDTNTGVLTYSTRFTNGVDGVTGLDAADWVEVSPDGTNVYAVGHWDDSLVIFIRNKSTGALTFSSVIKDGDTLGGKTVNGLDNPHALVLSADGKYVYVSGGTDSSLSVFTRDAANGGALTYSTIFIDGVGEIDGLNNATALVISPDGKNLYVTGDLDNALVEFTYNTNKGIPAYSNMFKNGVRGVAGLTGPHGIGISPDGRNVYVAGTGSDSLLVFDRR